ncbi:hypothetical protein L195_g063562, partial [Trifolium pratense]
MEVEVVVVVKMEIEMEVEVEVMNIFSEMMELVQLDSNCNNVILILTSLSRFVTPSYCMLSFLYEID